MGHPDMAVSADGSGGGRFPPQTTPTTAVPCPCSHDQTRPGSLRPPRVCPLRVRQLYETVLGLVTDTSISRCVRVRARCKSCRSTLTRSVVVLGSEDKQYEQASLS
jgi:hypothetical protein